MQRKEENVEFEDQELAFNKDLKKVGVVVRDLKRLMKKCVFKCWLTDEEKKRKKKKDSVYQAKLLMKFWGGGQTFTIWTPKSRKYKGSHREYGLGESARVCGT